MEMAAMYFCFLFLSFACESANFLQQNVETDRVLSATKQEVQFIRLKIKQLEHENWFLLQETNDLFAKINSKIEKKSTKPFSSQREVFLKELKAIRAQVHKTQIQNEIIVEFIQTLDFQIVEFNVHYEALKKKNQENGQKIFKEKTENFMIDLKKIHADPFVTQENKKWAADIMEIFLNMQSDSENADIAENLAVLEMKIKNS